MASLTRPQVHGVVSAALLPELIEDYFVAKRSGRKIITTKTEQTYRIHIKPFLSYWLQYPNRHNHCISTETMDDFYQYLTTESLNYRGEKLAQNTIAHCLIVLRQIFERN